MHIEKFAGRHLVKKELMFGEQPHGIRASVFVNLHLGNSYIQNSITETESKIW